MVVSAERILTLIALNEKKVKAEGVKIVTLTIVRNSRKA